MLYSEFYICTCDDFEGLHLFDTLQGFFPKKENHTDNNSTIFYPLKNLFVFHPGQHDCTRTQRLSEDIPVRFIESSNRAKHRFSWKKHISVIFKHVELSDGTVCFRPKRLTLKGYKQYWFKFQDTSISYFKSKEESIGEPIQQINLKGEERLVAFFIFIIASFYVTSDVPMTYCIMLIFRFRILYWVTTKIGLHALMLRNTLVVSYCPVLQLCILPLSETLF